LIELGFSTIACVFPPTVNRFTEKRFTWTLETMQAAKPWRLKVISNAARANVTRTRFHAAGSSGRWSTAPLTACRHSRTDQLRVVVVGRKRVAALGDDLGVNLRGDILTAAEAN
jgi:hypothetical protein